MNKRATVVATALAGVAISLTACSSSGNATTSNNSSSGATMASSQFGPACSKVPTDPSNPGSFDAMAKVPVATAASGNPILSTLVTAVKKAGLVDTLNNAKHITVFAPDNDAFAKIPAKTLNAVLADKKKLTQILEYHVVGKQLSPSQLKGKLATLEGSDVVAKGSKPSITVGPTGTEAHVICGNIQTANATVYIIDSVMLPKS